MQRQDHGELSKTEAGKRKIAAASERLDRTVAEMGQQHKADLPQGENAPAMGQSQPPRMATTHGHHAWPPRVAITRGHHAWPPRATTRGHHPRVATRGHHPRMPTRAHACPHAPTRIHACHASPRVPMRPRLASSHHVSFSLSQHCLALSQHLSYVSL